MLFNYLLLLIFNHQIAKIYSITYVSLETDKVGSNEKEVIEKDRSDDHRVENLEEDDPPEPPTRVNYEAPGQWAKPPLDKNISLDFIPSKTYTQVRGHHSIKHLPRSQALLDATTDEEKDNAGRLRAVVSKKKVNTIYTEEGYEDAGYDHGAHQRDADFHEGYAKDLEDSPSSYETTPLYSLRRNKKRYEDDKNDFKQSTEASTVVDRKIRKKNKKNYLKNTSRERWPKTDLYPKYFVEKEGLKLEKDFEKKEDDIIDDSSEYSDEHTVRSDETSTKLMNIANFRDTIPAFTSPISTTINYGKIFWEFFKTDKPEQLSSIEVTTEPLFLTQNNTVKSVFQSSGEFSEIETNPTNLNAYKTWKPEEKKNEESLSQNPVTEHLLLEIGEKVRPREMENTKEYLRSTDIIEKTTEATSQPRFKLNDIMRETTNRMKYLKPSKIIRDVSATEYSSANTSSIDSSELKSGNVIDTATSVHEKNSLQNHKKPEYTVIIRSPSKPCDELSNGSKFNPSITSENNFSHHLIDDIDPNIINTELMDDERVIKPPFIPPLGQITYADYLRHNPYILQENPPPKETNQTLIKENSSPITIEYYSPQPRPHRFPRLLPLLSFMRGNFKNPQKSKFYEKEDLTRMLPPSPLSSSQYVEFSTIKSNTERPSQVNNEDIESHGNRRWTKLLLDKGMVVKSPGLRKKRKIDHLLNDAPSVVDLIVNREIEARFPDESNVDKGNDKESNNDEERQINKTTVSELFDISDDPENTENHTQLITQLETEKSEIDKNKYPFYSDKRVAGSSTLKYILNPLQVPQKTHGGMEFYNSRDEYLKCDDVNPDLSQITPETMEAGEESKNLEQERTVDLPRLRGLGAKLSCFKAKYFDKKPLDNPLFMEKRIDTWQPLEEFNLQQFKSRIPSVSSKARTPVYHRISKKPEFNDLYRSESKNNPSKSKFNETLDGNSTVLKRKLLRRKHPTITSSLSPYEKQVYEDVMGTIKNLARMTSSRLIKEQDSLKMTSLRPPPTLPYKKNNKVIYRMQPREQLSSKSSKIIELVKSTRIHKRSIDSDEKSPRQPVYTINDRIRFSKPRDFLKYGKFTTEMTTTVKTRRKEPRYSNPKEKSEDYLYTTHFEEPLHSTASVTGTSVDGSENTENREEHVRATEYEAHRVTEKLTESPKVINETTSVSAQETRNTSEKKKNDESESKQEVEEEEEEEEAEEEEEEEDSHSEQIEKPAKVYTDDSQSSVESYSNEEENVATMSGTEESFERFSGRPLSPAESFYDPKYADLGPRINKPAFYHPPFNPPLYELNRGKHYESHEDADKRESGISSKYVFPWNESENSEESRGKRYHSSRYSYPWRRSGKLSKKNGKNMRKRNNNYYLNDESNEDQLSSETGLNFRVLYPLERWRSLYEKNYGKKRFRSSEFLDSDEDNSEFHKNESKMSGDDVEDIAKSIINFLNVNINESSKEKKIELTTVTPQIPPTSSTLTQKVETTTPIIQMTTQRERQIYTVKPRHFSKKIIMEKFERTNSPVASESTIIQITSRPNTLKLIRNSQLVNSRDRKSRNESSTPRGRRRSPMRTTTTTTFTTRAMHTSRSNNSQRRRKSPKSKLAMTTSPPTKANEYHQSKLSTLSEKKRYPSVSREKEIHETKEVERISLVPPLEMSRIEGSGETEKDESNSNMHQLQVKYIKEPDQRLYTYVEDISL